MLAVQTGDDDKMQSFPLNKDDGYSAAALSGEWICLILQLICAIPIPIR